MLIIIRLVFNNLKTFKFKFVFINVYIIKKIFDNLKTFKNSKQMCKLVISLKTKVDNDEAKRTNISNNKNTIYNTKIFNNNMSDTFQFTELFSVIWLIQNITSKLKDRIVKIIDLWTNYKIQRCKKICELKIRVWHIVIKDFCISYS